MNKTNSIKAFKQANIYMPGGVNSPARAFKSVGSDPLFIQSAKGARMKDIDGNEFIDYVGSWGPMILGHAHPDVLAAIASTASLGTSFGAPTTLETQMAEKITKMVPSVEMVRMVNSGTEATMSALRLARGYTQRDLVVKFEGCYHGHGDSFLIKAGSGALTLGAPNSPGVTEGTARDTIMASYNNIDSVRNIFRNHGDKIAAVILEPVSGNMGVIVPSTDFMHEVRELCNNHKAVLIFDEVMTGFRVQKGGAQAFYNIQPDLTTFGKIIGGGLPVGAYGGKKEIMKSLAPLGNVYQAGTLSGNPLAMAAGLTTLNLLDNTPGFYETLNNKSNILVHEIKQNFNEKGIPVVLNQAGSMFTVFFTSSDEVNTYTDVLNCDTSLFAKYFNACLTNGLYFAPSQFEAVFVSMAHTDSDIEQTIDQHRKALKTL